MQVEVFTLSNINFLAHHQKTSLLWNKTQEGLVQADLRSYCQKAAWTCPGQVWPPMLEDTILQHRPRAFDRPALPRTPLPCPRVCSTPPQIHAMKTPAWRVSPCPPVIADTLRRPFLLVARQRRRSDPVMRPRAKSGAGWMWPISFLGSEDWAGWTQPLYTAWPGLCIGGRSTANTPTKYSQVLSGFPELWFFFAKDIPSSS